MLYTRNFKVSVIEKIKTAYIQNRMYASVKTDLGLLPLLTCENFQLLVAISCSSALKISQPTKLQFNVFSGYYYHFFFSKAKIYRGLEQRIYLDT